MLERQSDSVGAKQIGVRPDGSGSVLAVLALGWVTLLAACSGDSGSGAVEVKWDRVTCERCRMVLSDRQHSAQVRISRPDGRSEVLFFDDIGCAVIWLEGRSPELRESPSTEVWVTDWRNGDWIDARAATYVPGQVTPMEYGLGAQLEPREGGMDFPRAKEHIFEVDRRFSIHDAHLDAASWAGSTHKRQ
jgi:hypothetical protein